MGDMQSHSTFITLTLSLVLLFLNGDTLGDELLDVVARPGHYPAVWCQVSDVVLDTKQKVFLVDAATESLITSQCRLIGDIWPVRSRKVDSKESVTCDVEWDEGHVFTIYYYGRSSNYFHLHYDMMIPLYQTLYHDIDELPKNVALLPSVETRRLQAMDWETKAFSDASSYWMQLLKLLTSDGTKMIPLDEAITNTSSKICFKKLYFGTSKYNKMDVELISGFAQYVKDKLYVLERPLTPDSLRVGLITRANRRRILNEAELVEAIRPFAEIDLVRFEGLKIREQVALTQRYAVIIGINGAGLMNALFRAEHSVAIQLVPYEARVNHVQFGHLLEATGHYLVWHNKHKDKHFQSKRDVNNNNADTEVHVEEFKQLVLQAISVVKDAILGVKDEL